MAMGPANLFKTLASSRYRGSTEIIMANGTFFWAMVMRAQYPVMSFFFLFLCVSVCCWFHFVPVCSRSFQLVPGGSIIKFLS